jgi:hypothetical protein
MDKWSLRNGYSTRGRRGRFGATLGVESDSNFSQGNRAGRAGPLSAVVLVLVLGFPQDVVGPCLPLRRKGLARAVTPAGDFDGRRRLEVSRASVKLDDFLKQFEEETAPRWIEVGRRRPQNAIDARWWHRLSRLEAARWGFRESWKIPTRRGMAGPADDVR